MRNIQLHKKSVGLSNILELFCFDEDYCAFMFKAFLLFQKTIRDDDFQTLQIKLERLYVVGTIGVIEASVQASSLSCLYWHKSLFSNYLDGLLQDPSDAPRLHVSRLIANWFARAFVMQRGLEVSKSFVYNENTVHM